ncbi:PASTA domain-containing protein [Candidatus Sumerlaeota bacterium]|nr:PASTA domain-containing protein [Candidatus Sumerlaeota bacterium]
MDRLRGSHKPILNDEERRGCGSILWFGIRILFMAGIAFILLSTISYFVIRRFVVVPEQPVPNVVGLAPAHALRILSEKKFTMSFDKYEFSKVLEEGRIVSQYPQGGVPAKIGSPVRVVLSKGSPLVTVPDVRGETEVGAGIKIRGAELQLGAVAGKYDNRVKKDTVISQDPSPHTGCPRNHPVKLLVSLGPFPDKFIMPSLLRIPLSEARGILQKSGFDIAEIKSVNSTVPRDIVVSQIPIPGAVLSHNTTIVLSVSR